MGKRIIVVRVGEIETQIVHMEDNSSNPMIYGCLRFSTPENAVQDGMITNTTELVARINKVCLDKGIKTKDAIFTITSNKIASRDLSVPIVNRKKMHSLVMAKVKDLFPVDIEKYVFSYVMQGKPREDEDGNKVQDFMVFAAPSELVDSYYKLAAELGVRIVALEADGNAVFQIMKRQAKSKVSMSVQINSTTTVVNIISDNRLLLQRVVPYGVNVFTEAMTQEPAFEISTDEEAYELLKNNRVLMERLRAENVEQDISLEKRIEVTDNASFLLGNISRVIEYYNTKYKDQPIQEIICMGAGCAIVGIHELMTHELGIPTYTPQRIQGVRFNRNISINAYILQYISSFGSVFEPVKFTPRLIEQKAQKKGSLTGAVLIFAACMLLSIVVCGFSIMQLNMTKEENKSLKRQVVTLSPIEDEYNTLMAIELNHKTIGVMDDFTITNNNKFHALLKEIEQYVPKTFRIQNISSDEKHVTISAVSTDKLLSLSALQIQLNKITEIENVKLDSITKSEEAITKQKQYTYTISFDYVNEIEKESKGKEGEQP